MNAPLLEVEDLQIALPARPQPVVAGVGFRLAAGECLALIGASGSGKSLTGTALIGLLPNGASVRGSIRFAGEELVAAAGAVYAAPASAWSGRTARPACIRCAASARS